MLFREFQTYTTCSVPKCAVKRSNRFYDLKQIVNKGGEEVFPHEQSQGASVYGRDCTESVYYLFVLFFPK